MVIAFLGSKGGVGKSTIAGALCLYLHKEGYDVRLVDSDPQASSSAWVSAAESKIKTIRATTEDDLLPAIWPQKGSNADFVIVDGRAGNSEVTRLIMLKSEYVFLPVTPSPFDIEAITTQVSILNEVHKINVGKPFARLIANRIMPKESLSDELLEMGHIDGVEFTRNYLRYRHPYRDMLAKGTVAWEMGVLRQGAAKELTKLCKEILKLVLSS